MVNGVLMVNGASMVANGVSMVAHLHMCTQASQLFKLGTIGNGKWLPLAMVNQWYTIEDIFWVPLIIVNGIPFTVRQWCFNGIPLKFFFVRELIYCLTK